MIIKGPITIIFPPSATLILLRNCGQTRKKDYNRKTAIIEKEFTILKVNTDPIQESSFSSSASTEMNTIQSFERAENIRSTDCKELDSPLRTPSWNRLCLSQETPSLAAGPVTIFRIYALI
ncbi:hypothetical protein CHS0354_017984 [Potamilus streckersoni]|uniref:Uncharacterized protein n=1 Tax=Potamilus streckersoni TaxID=2493646 RepID=A0AAE0VE61_9BIVA|nr:hypothetical protein CHS0354_017984 [Potamilus streckersoni]